MNGINKSKIDSCFSWINRNQGIPYQEIFCLIDLWQFILHSAISALSESYSKDEDQNCGTFHRNLLAP